MNLKNNVIDKNNHVLYLFYKLFFFILISFVSMMMSCSHEKAVSPVEIFRNKHPELSAKYVSLNPTSYESMFNYWRFHCLSIEMLLDNIIGEFSACDNLNTYLLQIKKNQCEECSSKLNSLRKLRRIISSSDYLYEFEYKDGQIEESGLLIINISGDIKYREVSISTRYWIE